MAEKVRNTVCIDCKSASICVTVRTRDLCEYRLRNAPKDRQRKLLLPLSYGISSMSLLHIISGLLGKQRSTGQKRTAFDLHVLVVDPISSRPSKSPAESGRLDRIKEVYPGNTYTEIPLHRIFGYDTDIESVVSQYTTSPSACESLESDEATLNLFRASFSTSTARADIDTLLLRRLIVAFAKSHECDGILWGDSDSRLAAKTLANVAKGRGSSLVWDVCDGLSPWGIYFNFPLRDLYKTELELYASYVLSALQPVIERDLQDFGNMTNRSMSIEDLMSQYVLTQGAKYPGVMANIVRTVDKLKTPQVESGKMCMLCETPVDALPEATADREECNGPLDPGKRTIDQLTCYGCMRTLLDLKALSLPLG
ncbi:Cytoplasmic tRNA 2-thiolation protein 2 [Emydomyces testavorans]|uniref:Cytoplasmic tRNA 2-thiolation protein 2 n=1 Tax=Emydomyces testavorans TaxID=2070801 RepID=A0AAF0DPE5_9EURO|nr:Cytoplasmic tRNA 2-thiolation protein 2 [Emydomyces testavorans]